MTELDWNWLKLTELRRPSSVLVSWMVWNGVSQKAHRSLIEATEDPWFYSFSRDFEVFLVNNYTYVYVYVYVYVYSCTCTRTRRATEWIISNKVQLYFRKYVYSLYTCTVHVRRYNVVQYGSTEVQWDNNFYEVRKCESTCTFVRKYLSTFVHTKVVSWNTKVLSYESTKVQCY